MPLLERAARVGEAMAKQIGGSELPPFYVVRMALERGLDALESELRTASNKQVEAMTWASLDRWGRRSKSLHMQCRRIANDCRDAGSRKPQSFRSGAREGT